MDNDFDNVSWGAEPEDDISRPNTAGRNDAGGRSFRPGSRGRRRVSDSGNQAGHLADRVDLGGIGDGRLECTVEAPLKENDGTKDAYVSYLVTTHVCLQMHLKTDPRITYLLIFHFRRTLKVSRNPPSQSAAVSPTSSFSTKPSIEITPHVPFLLSPTSTKWNT